MKWLKWTGQLLLTVILVSTLTLLTTGLIVQSYISSLLASFNITWEGAPNNLAAVFQGALGMNTSDTSESTGMNPDSSNSGSDLITNGTDLEGDQDGNTDTGSETNLTGKTDMGQADPNEPDSTSGDGSGGGTDNEASSSADHEGSSEGGSPDSSSASPSSSSTTEEGAGAGTAEPDDQVVVTPEDITDQKDSISTEDKTAVFELLMNKIPADEMQQISSTMEDGLTETELQNMEQVIAKYLTEEEYNELMAVLTP